VEDNSKPDLIPCGCGCGELIKSYYVDPRGTKQYPRRFKHGHHCKRENHYMWKGGRYKSSKGYILVYSPNHPYANDGYVFEHRLVMEQHIGRYLIPNVDDVHHINGVKNDNRIQNLQLLQHGQHTILTNTKNLDHTCSICSSDHTVMVNRKRIGLRPMWYYNQNRDPVCKRCYDRLRKAKPSTLSLS
jgi:HNH endonuclease